MKNLFVIIVVLLNTFSFAQKGSYYGNPADAADFCTIQLEMTSSFATNNDAQLALDKIINVLGVSQRFAIYQCNGIDNCQAVTIRGVRYIFYDSYFMKEISNNAKSSWTNLSILAHEIGHHINGHTVDLIAAGTGQLGSWSLSENRQRELEADEFSGYVLYKLGATLFEAQQAINMSSFNGDDSYSTHPNKSKRLAAIEKGFLNAKNPSSQPLPALSNSNNLSEYYFYLAFNNQFGSNPNFNYIVDNYNKAIQQNPNCAQAYNNRGIIRKNQKLYSDALSDFNKCIELDSKNVSAYVNKATVYFFLKDIYKGIDLVNMAISIDPKFAIAYNNRGAFKGALGDHYGAIKDFDISISLNPNYTQSFLSRGLSKGAVKDWYGAIADHDIVINREPKNAFAYKMRGLEKMMVGAYYCGDFISACRLGDCELYNQHTRECR